MDSTIFCNAVKKSLLFILRTYNGKPIGASDMSSSLIMLSSSIPLRAGSQSISRPVTGKRINSTSHVRKNKFEFFFMPANPRQLYRPGRRNHYVLNL